jgi:hypothetical protein
LRRWTWPQWFAALDFLEYRAAQQKKANLRNSRNNGGGARSSGGMVTTRYVDMIAADVERANRGD